MSLMLIPSVNDIRNEFIHKYKNKDFINTKSDKLIEIPFATFEVTEPIIFGSLNTDYAKREVKWYKSQSLNVYDISGKVPQIWQTVSDRNGFINSNYGYLIWSKDNFDQYKNCLRELKRDKESRRATMIYNRPSIHYEYNKDGMSDFICTYANQFLIRDNELHSHYIMRSNDAIFGFKNDVYWMNYVHDKLLSDLQETYPDLKKGKQVWTAVSLHVYERHFYLIEKYIKENS